MNSYTNTRILCIKNFAQAYDIYQRIQSISDNMLLDDSFLDNSELNRADIDVLVTSEDATYIFLAITTRRNTQLKEQFNKLYLDDMVSEIIVELRNIRNNPDSDGSIGYLLLDTANEITTEEVHNTIKNVILHLGDVEYIDEQLESVFGELGYDNIPELIKMFRSDLSNMGNSDFNKGEPVNTATPAIQEAVVSNTNAISNLENIIQNKIKGTDVTAEDLIDTLIQLTLSNKDLGTPAITDYRETVIEIGNESVADTLEVLHKIAESINSKWTEVIAPWVIRNLQHFQFFKDNKDKFIISKKDKGESVIAKVINNSLHIELLVKDLSSFGIDSKKSFDELKEELNKTKDEKTTKFIKEYNKFTKPLKEVIIPFINKNISIFSEVEDVETDLVDNKGVITSVSKITTSDKVEAKAKIGTESVEPVVEPTITDEPTTTPEPVVTEPVTTPEPVEAPVEDNTELGLMKTLIDAGVINSDDELFNYMANNRGKFPTTLKEATTNSYYAHITTGADLASCPCTDRVRVRRTITLR